MGIKVIPLEDKSIAAAMAGAAAAGAAAAVEGSKRKVIKTYTGPTSTNKAKNHMLRLMIQGKNAAMIGDKRGQTVVVRPGKLSQEQRTQARSTLLQRKMDDPSIQKEEDAGAKLTPPPETPILPAQKKAGGGAVYRGRKYASGGRVAKYKG